MAKKSYTKRQADNHFAAIRRGSYLIGTDVSVQFLDKQGFLTFGTIETYWLGSDPRVVVRSKADNRLHYIRDISSLLFYSPRHCGFVSPSML